MTTRGITVLAGGVRDTQAVATRAEAAGFDAVWSGEFLNRSAVVSVAAMAAGTERIGVGSAIAYAVGRSPLVLANDAKFLDEMSDGRFTLGLGTGTRKMMQARREVAAQIAFYVAPKSYGPVMEASGFGAEASAIQDAFRNRDHEAMIAAVSDRMLAEMAVWGTAEEVRQALPAIEKRYDHAALYSPSFTLSSERVEENTEAIIETFAAR